MSHKATGVRAPFPSLVLKMGPDVFILGTILFTDSSSDTSLPQVSLTGAHVPENFAPRVTEAHTPALLR